MIGQWGVSDGWGGGGGGEVTSDWVCLDRYLLV